jgi:putative membrane protein
MSDQHFEVDRKLHPLTIAYRIIANIPSLAFSFYIATRSSEEWFIFLINFALGLLVFYAFFVSYFFITYRITPTEFYVATGIFSRQRRSIPIERIQNVAITQSFLQRLFRIAKVTIETAGGTGTEGTLEFVSLQNANEIRSYILRHKYGESVNSEHQQDQIEEEKDVIHSLSTKETWLVACFQFSPMFFIFVFIAFQYLYTLFPDSVITITKDQIEQNFLKQTSPILVAVAIAVVFVVSVLASWLLGMLISFNKYYSFKAVRVNKTVVIQSGLFVRINTTIPLKRIQAISITSNPLLKLLGYSTINIFTAGIREAQQLSSTVIPLIKNEKVKDFTEILLGFQTEKPREAVASSTFYRYLSQGSTNIILPCIALSIFYSQWFLLGIIFGIVFIGVMLIAVRKRKYEVNKTYIAVQRGFYSTIVTIIPLRKVQTVEYSQSIFLKFWHIAEISIDTASHLGSKSVISCLGNVDALELTNRITELFIHKKTN